MGYYWLIIDDYWTWKYNFQVDKQKTKITKTQIFLNLGVFHKISIQLTEHGSTQYILERWETGEEMWSRHVTATTMIKKFYLHKHGGKWN